MLHKGSWREEWKYVKETALQRWRSGKKDREKVLQAPDRDFSEARAEDQGKTSSWIFMMEQISTLQVMDDYSLE